jgi:hypothetical protein
MIGDCASAECMESSGLNEQFGFFGKDQSRTSSRNVMIGSNPHLLARDEYILIFSHSMLPSLALSQTISSLSPLSQLTNLLFESQRRHDNLTQNNVAGSLLINKDRRAF